MNIAIISYGQETSSFSPLLTTLDTFKLYGLYEGDALIGKCREGAVGGFMDEMGPPDDWTPLPLIHGWAGANGPLTMETLAFFEDKIVSGLKRLGSLDALYVAMHGAAAAQTVPDTEGYLLKAIRDVVGPELPLVLSLDHHANITADMMHAADAVVAHREQPHDQYETGQLAAQLLRQMMAGAKPVIAWRKIPMIAHQEQFLTSKGPMKTWFDLARKMEQRPGVMAVSNYPMQPWLDVPDGGWGVSVVVDGEQAAAEAIADEVADCAWRLREDFCRLESVPAAVAVARAEQAEAGLVVLCDMGDNTFGGGAGDSTAILSELICQNISGLALLSIVDAPAVDKAIAAGVGGTITTEIGGTLDAVFSRPLEITAHVAGIGGGQFDVSVVGFDSFDLGRAVLLEIGQVRLVVSEQRGIGGNHPVVYQHFGIDVADAKVVVVKTGSNWQYYQEWIAEVIRCATPGATMSNIEDFDWQHLPRPIFPLDIMGDSRQASR